MNLTKFEWDRQKSAANLKKHGVAFEDLPSVFEGSLMEAPDLRHNYGEDRWLVIGLLSDIPVVVVYTQRSDRIRLISARKATRHEAENFFKAFQK